MANKDWAFGLQPVTGPHGGAPETVRMPLKASYGTAIYKGQIVHWAFTGYILPNAVTLPTNVVGVAGEYHPASGSTQTDLAVYSAADHKFLIQSDGGTTSTNRASYLMLNVGVTGQAAGSTITGLSGMEIAFAGISSTATNAPLRVIDFRLQPGETVGGANPNCLVEFVHGFYRESDVTV